MMSSDVHPTTQFFFRIYMLKIQFLNYYETFPQPKCLLYIFIWLHFILQKFETDKYLLLYKKKT